jgi:hypothetical protein
MPARGSRCRCPHTYGTMKNQRAVPTRPFALKQPCADCPFRSDRPAFLRRDRAQGIADALEAGSSFSCHKTLLYDDSGRGEPTAKTAFCAGALVTLEKQGAPNQLMQIGERLGLYRPDELNMDAPVYGSLAAWVDAHGSTG